SFGSEASTARSSFSVVPGLGAATGNHRSPPHRIIATAVGISGSPIPPTAHASADVTAVTPRSVVGASPGFALRTTSQVGAHVGGGEAEGPVGAGGAVTSSAGPPAAETAAEPIAKVAMAATDALTSPLRLTLFAP